MRLWIMSDLHLDVHPESHPFKLPKERPECDAVIIAGDICEGGGKAITWVANQVFGVPVFVVMGNHEPYRDAIEHCRERAAEVAVKYSNIHILQDSHVDVGGARFIGATLWTDYELYGAPYAWQSYTAAATAMNDHRLIRVASDGYRKWRTKDAWREHCVSRDYIEQTLLEPFKGPRIVVTHHAPSQKSIDHKRYAGDTLNGAYVSNLDHLVDQADLWVHGHLHKVSDYTIGDGRVVCNPRGYVSHGEDTGFNPSLIIEVPGVSQRAQQAAE